MRKCLIHAMDYSYLLKLNKLNFSYWTNFTSSTLGDFFSIPSSYQFIWHVFIIFNFIIHVCSLTGIFYQIISDVFILYIHFLKLQWLYVRSFILSTLYKNAQLPFCSFTTHQVMILSCPFEEKMNPLTIRRLQPFRLLVHKQDHFLVQLHQSTSNNLVSSYFTIRDQSSKMSRRLKQNIHRNTHSILWLFCPLQNSLEDFAPVTNPRVPLLIVDCVTEIERRGLDEVNLSSVSFHIYIVPSGSSALQLLMVCV